MRKFGEYLRSSLVICSFFVGCVIFPGGDAGRTFKLPHYDVTFGTWPLMEITKRGSPYTPAGRGIRGGRYFSPSPITTGYRLGPPPPPGKLVMLSPNENKGAIHHHLQETLRHYATSKVPSNVKLPIIVKASGPNPPPPPPGYKLGPGPNNGLFDDSWKPGPPPLSGTGGVRSSRLLSMLQNTALSGIFGNGVGTYSSPQYSSGPPFSGSFMTITPDGTQITTNVNNAFAPGPLRLSEAEMVKPSIPPVLSIGGDTSDIPENYSLVYAERQLVGVKSPDTLEHSGHHSPGLHEYEVGVNLGTKYEQGYGPKPPPTHPLVITKFQKRGHTEPVKVLVDQSLPDTGVILTTSSVVSAPNISAPLGGRNHQLFKEALEEKHHIQKLRKTEQPLDAQVKLLGRLFTKLQRLKPSKIAVPEDELDHELNADSGAGHGWGGEEDDGSWKTKAKTKVDSPLMAVQIQSYSAPEVNSADPDIIESMAEFGTHDVRFADTDEIVNLMDTALRHGSSRIRLNDLGSNPQEINENMLNWVRSHLAKTREANQQSHSKVANIASQQFAQYQTIVTPPFGNNGWGPAEPKEIDPKRGRPSYSQTSTYMMAGMNPPQINKRR